MITDLCNHDEWGQEMRSFTLAAAFLLATAACASAQQGDFSAVEVKVERIVPGVAVLMGAGGNIGLSYGEDGNAIIDDQYAPLTDKIIAAIKTVHPDPVRFVINTHWHGDHTGGNENFGKAGAVIVAHDNVRKRMSAEQVSTIFAGHRTPASPKSALPVLTFTESVTLHLNGDDLDIVHVAKAHTDGDSLIRWRRANVLHMGDVFFHQVSFPFIDVDSGGSIDGAIAGVKRGLELSDDKTRIIPGHGPVATRSDLATYLIMLEDVRAKVLAGINSGQSLADIQASGPAAPYGMTDGFMKPDQFVALVYSSLGGK